MSASNSYYSALLKKKKIVYMPTCLVIERMTRLYSRISKIQSQMDLASQLKDVMTMLAYFRHDLKCTSAAYAESRIKFFVGDWKQDRLRAKKLFANLQARIAYFGDCVDQKAKARLLDLNEKLGEEWARLGDTLDSRCGSTLVQDSSNTCRYFRSTTPNSWQQVMARTLISLGGMEDCSGGDSYLLLLCYTRIKTQLLREIEQVEKKYNLDNKFPAGKILCVSDSDTNINCPRCMTMVECVGRECHYDPHRRAPDGLARRLGCRSRHPARDQHAHVQRSGLLASALGAMGRSALWPLF